MERAAAAYTSVGEVILTGSVTRWLGATGEYQLDGYSSGTDVFIRGYDRYGRMRWQKFDGDGIGYEYASLHAAGDRVYAHGTYSRRFEFETLSIAMSASSRPAGWVVQMTITD